MKSIMVLFLFLMLSFSAFASAEIHTVSIKGEPRTLDNEIDLMYGVGAQVNGIEISQDKFSLDNEEGVFEIKDINFESQEQVNVWVQGGCFYHAYFIKRVGDDFVVTDSYAPEKGSVITTKENIIDLGVLKEDKSNQIMVDSDVGLSFQAFDMNGEEVALNGGYGKFVGMSNSFKSNSQYRIVVKDENGNTWEKEVTTGNYCESTRIIKRRDLLVVENFPNNSFPPISFSRKISLFFKSIFG